MRVSSKKKLNYDTANKLKYILEKVDGVHSCKVSTLSSSIILDYEESSLSKLAKKLLEIDLKSLESFEIEDKSFIPLEEKGLFHILRDAFEMRFIFKTFVPSPFREILTICRAYKFIKKGIESIFNRRIDVSLLDASAIFVSLASRDYASASSIMFLLNLGEDLEEWTLKKSQGDLARTMELNVDKVFVVNGNEKYVKDLKDVEIGDLIEVTMGTTIPVDGKVVKGMGMVNQSSFTGESIPVEKIENSTVFAGTVLEEGILVVETEKLYNDSRINKIIELIAQSEKNKSLAQKRAENAADSLVKYSFLGSILAYAFTRNFTRAKAFLMVDFSCALKLTIPISVMKAMSQAGRNGILVKGGKYLENIAEADSIIFDKTGTLTKSQPTVEKVIAFEGYSEDEALRIAACLEEHFPHSIANAVVNAALEKNLHHKEMHSETEYIVAHGISSKIAGKPALIGSEHFIFEDEKVNLPKKKKTMIDKLKENYSLLYLAYDGELIAVICISDPIREDAKYTIKELRKLGFKNIAMLTGDAENAARYVAEQLDIDYYKSGVLPEDKAKYVLSEKKRGRKVIMIGDGINDSVALSNADVGISMHEGADIAREIADISIGNDDLKSIIYTIKIARELQERIKDDYRKIISFNSLLILLGFYQILPNTGSSFLHNSSTVVMALENMQEYKIS